VALVIVTVAVLVPLPVHPSVVVMATGPPEEAVAATPNAVFRKAADGAGLVTVMPWVLLMAVVAFDFGGAGL